MTFNIRYLAAILATVCIFAGTGWCGVRNREEIRERIKDRYEKVFLMRQAAMEFFQAKDSGDRDAAQKAAEKAAEYWKSLPENWQNAIEKKHPGTAERVVTLKDEIDLPDELESVDASNGKTITSQGSWTRDDGTVTHTGTATGEDGKTATVDAAYTRDGNTVTKEATFTGPNGKTAEQDVKWQKDGDSTTRDGTTVTSGGKSVTSHDEWTRSGNTVEHEGTSTTSGGKTTTREDTWTKEGNVVTHEGAVKTDKSAAKSWKPSYKDNDDVFGGRPKPSAKTKTSTKASGATGKKR